MGKQMIISIGREYGSGGHDIATLIAEHFKIPLYDKTIMANLLGSEISEHDEKAPSFLTTRRVRGHSTSFEEILTEKQFDFIRKKAESGESFIILGRCAEQVLKGNPSLISIFVLADMDYKIDRLIGKFHYNQDEAIGEIKRNDYQRKKYHNRYSEYKWGDSREYDLCVKSNTMKTEGTAKFLIDYINKRYEEF